MAESTAQGNRQAASTALKWRNLKTGVIFLLGMIIAAALAFIIGKNSGLLTAHHDLFIFAPDMKGLQEGNFVSVSGKKVGTVKKIDFSTDRTANAIKITLEIQGKGILTSEDFFSMITKDSKATIKSLGILGDKIVDISLGTSKEKVVDGDTLATQSEEGMEDLTSNAIQAMKNVNQLTDKINRGEGTLGQLITSDSLSRKINMTLANLNIVTTKLYAGNGLLPRLLNDGALAQQVEQTTKDLSAMTAKLKDGNGSLGKFLLGDEFLVHLNNVSVRTDSLLTMLNNENGSLAKMSRDPALYDNMNASVISAHQAIISLDSLLTDFKKNPGKYVNVRVF